MSLRIPADRAAKNGPAQIAAYSVLLLHVTQGRCYGVHEMAEWLQAEYHPFGAHSHYGLVVGEESHEQVADVIRAFLEHHRL